MRDKQFILQPPLLQGALLQVSTKSSNANLVYSSNVVGRKACIVTYSSCSKGQPPPLGLNFKLRGMHSMTMPKVVLGLVGRNTSHHYTKRHSSKPLGKMYACSLQAFTKVFELLV